MKDKVEEMCDFAVPEPDLGCATDGDCPSRQACIIKQGYGECVNPCLEFRPCAANARCEVKDELPLRVMTCTCEPGFSGKGDEFCEPISKLEQRYFHFYGIYY